MNLIHNEFYVSKAFEFIVGKLSKLIIEVWIKVYSVYTWEIGRLILLFIGTEF